MLRIDQDLPYTYKGLIDWLYEPVYSRFAGVGAAPPQVLDVRLRWRGVCGTPHARTQELHCILELW